MQSWSFIESFIYKNKLAVAIIAANGWDRDSNQLQISDDVYDVEREIWLVENSNGVIGPPPVGVYIKNFLNDLLYLKISNQD